MGAVGDKIILTKDMSGKEILIETSTASVSDKSIIFHNNTNQIITPLSTCGVGDKVVLTPSAGGKEIVIKSGASAPPGTNTWTGRAGHRMVALSDDSLLIIGGNGAGNVYFNDVWHSTDSGATWHQHSTGAVWVGRCYFGSVVLSDDTVLVIGGATSTGSGYSNGIWKSTNAGVSWTLVHAENSTDWKKRAYFPVVVLSNNNLVICGGRQANYVSMMNDVQRSTNGGATWTELIPNYYSPWTLRENHDAVVTQDDDIILFGGWWSGSPGIFNDVWLSENGGASWSNVTTDADWIPRYTHRSVITGADCIVMIGGVTTNAWLSNEVWNGYSNGAVWGNVQSTAPFPAREYPAVCINSTGKIILSGGLTTAGTYSNDVWISPHKGISWKQVSD